LRKDKNAVISQIFWDCGKCGTDFYTDLAFED